MITRHFIVVLTGLLLIAGCSRPTESTTSTKPDGARLSQAEVIRIAGDAATKQGYRLTDYKVSEAHYEFTRKDKTWSVFYDGKVPMPGHHFLVWINDQTGATQVMAGE